MELSWIPNDAFGGIKSAAPKQDDAAAGSEDGSSATVREGETDVGKVEMEEERGDADMDVADDVDQWL